jgi:2-iminobutanoate/2-iminopropanoate deaminase
VKESIATQAAPAAIGPYSQAIRFSGPMLYISGQIPLDPATMKLVEGGIEEQTRRVMENLKAVLGASGCGLDDIVKTTIYLTSLEDFKAVNQVYGEYFAEQPPARATVEVSALPMGAAVEIEAVAVLPQ